MIVLRSFSKVYMPHETKEVSQLSDKQLENLSNYLNLTEKQRSNIKKAGVKLSLASGVVGGGTAALLSGFNGKAAATGAIGGAIRGRNGAKKEIKSNY